MRALPPCLAVFAAAALTLGAVASEVSLDPLVEFAEGRSLWTGIAVSQTGRVFVCYPRWSPDVAMSVAEIFADGTALPYPNDSVNGWEPGQDAAAAFVCVQSVHVDANGRLWVLDAGSPMLSGVVPGGAKLIRIDLETDEITRTYQFDGAAAPETSYLNDVRVDTETETAFVTDSGLGAIIVLDLETGAARRVLEDDRSTKAEDTPVVIGETPFATPVHADGIALDPEGRWVYYQALTGRTLYRVPVAALLDESLAADALAGMVERFAESGVSDGLLFGPGGVYLSSIEDGSVKRVDAGGQVETLVQDPRIIWPDSFALDKNGRVWFTTSQIHLGPNPPSPYRVLRLTPEELAPRFGMGDNPVVFWEIASHDAEESVRFLEEALGWSFLLDEGSGIYHVPGNTDDGSCSGGVFTLRKAKLPFLTVYVLVDDIDERAKRIEELGGHIVQGPLDISPRARICLFNEPSGVTLALLQIKSK